MVRATNAKTTVLDKLGYDQGYQSRLQTRKRENEVLHKNTLQYKADMHQKVVDFEADLSVKERKRKPFDAKMNEESLAKATVYREK